MSLLTRLALAMYLLLSLTGQMLQQIMMHQKLLSMQAMEPFLILWPLQLFIQKAIETNLVSILENPMRPSMVHHK